MLQAPSALCFQGLIVLLKTINNLLTANSTLHYSSISRTEIEVMNNKHFGGPVEGCVQPRAWNKLLLRVSDRTCCFHPPFHHSRVRQWVTPDASKPS